MPNEGQSDDLENLASQLTDQGNGQSPETQNLPTNLQPSGQHGQSQNGAQQQIFGKFKTMQDAEKGYKSSVSEMDKAKSRSRQLEGIVSNPRLMKMAQSDPELREALAKAGFAQVEAAQEEEPNDVPANVDEYLNSPEGIRAEMRAWRELDRELSGFQKQLGRDLTVNEHAEVMNHIALAPHLTMSQAYKLTSAYEATLKAREDKIRNEAGAKSRVNRPRPPAGLQPGAPQGSGKKSVGQMNSGEREQFIQDLMDNNS